MMEQILSIFARFPHIIRIGLPKTIFRFATSTGRSFSRTPYSGIQFPRKVPECAGGCSFPTGRGPMKEVSASGNEFFWKLIWRC
jgi:hypothetical protein